MRLHVLGLGAMHPGAARPRDRDTLQPMPNGAEALIRTLVGAGVTTCFTNPGTSEIHFVAALDSVPEMRAVLTLFEGVATGAADGYARMADAPAATLLHLGPGLGNGLANLHNARRARVPVVNIVGDHATYHAQYDAPLQSDIETIARNVSTWVRTSKTDRRPRSRRGRGGHRGHRTPRSGGDAHRAGRRLLAGGRRTRERRPQPAAHPRRPETPSKPPRRRSAGSRRTAILLGGRALRERGLLAAARIAAATGTKLLAEVFPARLERGAGLPAVERFAYWPEFASAQLDGLEHLILVDAKAPVSLFAYPGKESSLVPDGCEVHELSPPTSDVLASLEAVGGGPGCCGRQACAATAIRAAAA